ncbi:MAG: hypothetical protein LUE91_01460 [Oscillospiraceae bacterium]|nr:hypothetical protein [Oscillospiraceae bacterium]
MQQNIRDYKRHEQLAQRQEEKLEALQEIKKRYREVQQALERWRVQSFLVDWSEKEVEQAEIDRREAEKRDCGRDLAAVETRIEELVRQTEQKENRRRELDLACAQSSVFQEQEKLEVQKAALLEEQKKLLQNLQDVALEIKRETAKINSLCDDVLEWEEEDMLAPVQAAAREARRVYALFAGCNYEIFSRPMEIFEAAQQAAAALWEAARNTAHRAEDRLAEFEEQRGQKRAALENLRKNIKDYPRGLLEFKEKLASGLENRMGRPVQIDILADVLEIRDEAWRGAAEGYLNTQKFYLLVNPDCYREALRIYDQIKLEFKGRSFGLVDVGKLWEREKICVLENSLAEKIETENSLARSYIDYLLGRVVCCAEVEQLRGYKTAITAEGMLYQGYVARALRRELMEDAFIGRRAVALRIARLEAELAQLTQEVQRLNPVFQRLSQMKEALFTPYFVQATVAQRRADYLRGLDITKEVSEVEEQLSHLDLLWLEEQRKKIRELGDEIQVLGKEKEEKAEEKGKLGERIRKLEYETLPTLYQHLSELEDQLQENFPPEYQESTGLPRYKQELARLKRADAVHKNFSGRLAQSVNERDTAWKNLIFARREYTEQFKPCSFQIESPDNDEFEAEQARLEESELPKYREKIKAARESAMEQFQNDFLAKLKSNIDQVQDQVKT